jgi:osmoprotectant transport system substrate-binding protein
MRTIGTRTRKAAAVTAALALLTGGCALGADSDAGSSQKAAPGSLAKLASLKGVKVTVGSKEFTEQLILCEITAQALQSAGATVQRKCGLSGSDTTRKALTSGNIDMYWEYTGTAWISYLKHTKPVAGAEAQYKAVADEDKAKNKIVWLDRAPFNNTYAIAAAGKVAQRTGVTSLSAYAKLAKSKPADASLCVNGEFSSRDDGLPGVQKAYGFKLPASSVKTLEEGAIYNAIGKSDPCNFGMVATTDGRIKGLKLTVLKDDKAFFPVYNPAVNIRKQVLDAHPGIAKVLNPIAKSLDTDLMQSLNTEVDVKGLRPPETATKWLKSKGFIG